MIKRTAVLVFICLSLLQIATPVRAGQVVTDELRAWAAGVIAQEKQLSAITGEKSVAVLYFLNKTGDNSLDPLQKGMALMLITDLAKVKGISVVERVRLQALMEEMHLATSGLTTPGTSPRIGKLLRAWWIVGGDVAGSRQQMELRSRVLEVLNSLILGEPASQGSLGEVFRMEKDILFEIIKLLKIKLEAVEMEELKRPFSSSIEAAMAFFKGIDASDRKNYEMAARYYKEAVEKDEHLDIARDALNELKKLGLITGQSRSRMLLRSLKAQTSLTDRLIPEYPVKRMRSPGEVGKVENGNQGNQGNQGASQAGGGTGQSQQQGGQQNGGAASPGQAGGSQGQSGQTGGSSSQGQGSQAGSNPTGIGPNLPPDYGASVEPSRPATPPTGRPGAF